MLCPNGSHSHHQGAQHPQLHLDDPCSQGGLQVHPLRQAQQRWEYSKFLAKVEGKASHPGPLSHNQGLYQAIFLSNPRMFTMHYFVAKLVNQMAGAHKEPRAQPHGGEVCVPGYIQAPIRWTHKAALKAYFEKLSKTLR